MNKNERNEELRREAELIIEELNNSWNETMENIIEVLKSAGHPADENMYEEDEKDEEA